MDMTRGNERLLQLAKILDGADAAHRKAKEPTYDQRHVVHECGTPACAAGHWVVANPDRWEIRDGCTYLKGSRASPVRALSEEFALSLDECEDIFGGAGCDYAKTAKQAAKYIRNFVKSR
jgi:hypothetical protein